MYGTGVSVAAGLLLEHAGLCPGRDPSEPAPSGDGLTRKGIPAVVFDRAAGLDVGEESVTVCIRTPGP